MAEPSEIGPHKGLAVKAVTDWYSTLQLRYARIAVAGINSLAPCEVGHKQKDFCLGPLLGANNQILELSGRLERIGVVMSPVCFYSAR